MSIQLTDDGTLDTVLVCTECNEEFRYNYANFGDDDDEMSYTAFVDFIIDDADEHICTTNNRRYLRDADTANEEHLLCTTN